MKPARQAAGSAHGGGLPENVPRNARGQPYREAGDDCCRHYRFCGEAGADYRRCGWCRDFQGGAGNSVCTNKNNRRELK